MKIIGEILPEDVEKFLPRGLLDALYGDKPVEYCGVCDGIRQIGHDCPDTFLGLPKDEPESESE